MQEASGSSPSKSSAKRLWQEVVAKYQQPDLRQSIWQICNTFIPYFGLWYLMYLSMSVSYWLTLGLAVLAGGLLVRIFIIFHDCGHGSFFKSRRANDALGTFCGILVLSPYYQWRHEHAVHHATSGNLDHRGSGDILTLTVREYLQLSRWERLKYRLYRNPVVMLGLGPAWTFLVSQRIPMRNAKKRERYSVYWTNAALVLLIAGMSLLIGFKEFMLILLPVVLVAATLGIWMFYVQHQFEGTYWEHNDEWDYMTAALKGSSYYKLPRVLQWFTGNIGLHHIHHLSSRIPNYALERCHKENPIFQDVTTITLLSSLRSLSLKLWDEEQRKLVSFRDLKVMQSQGRVFFPEPEPERNPA